MRTSFPRKRYALAVATARGQDRPGPWRGRLRRHRVYNRGMGWLRGLFGATLNPEDYERVRCDRCDGTGHPPTGWTVLHPSSRDWRIPCGKCRGKGYIMVKRLAEALRDAHMAGRDAAAGGSPPVAEVASEPPLPPPAPLGTVSPPSAPEDARSARGLRRPGGTDESHDVYQVPDGEPLSPVGPLRPGPRQSSADDMPAAFAPSTSLRSFPT